MALVDIIRFGGRYRFSHGVLAGSLEAVGLSLEHSYEVVQMVADRIGERGALTARELRAEVRDVLKEGGFEVEGRRFIALHAIQRLERPLVLIIGGGTGTGKSTVAAEVAHRLGISTNIGTDTLREVLRFAIAPGLLPVLHQSTFQTSAEVDGDDPDSLLAEFRQQAALVCEAAEAVLERSAAEGLNLMLNGVHLIPGYLDLSSCQPDLTFEFMLAVRDLEEHGRRFVAREKGTMRSAKTYNDLIDRIREIQNYLLKRAARRQVPVIQNVHLPSTVQQIVEAVLDSVAGTLDRAI